MVKIGMTNPPFLKPVLKPLSVVLNHKNFYSYLHIPVQVESIFIVFISLVGFGCCVETNESKIYHTGLYKLSKCN